LGKRKFRNGNIKKTKGGSRLGKSIIACLLELEIKMGMTEAFFRNIRYWEAANRRNEKESYYEKMNSDTKKIINQKIDKNYLMDLYNELNQVPLVRNAESMKRLEGFAHECLEKNAPLSQGYYFNSNENVYQFIKEVVLAYYVGNDKYLTHRWKIIDSIEILDSHFTDKKPIPLTHFNKYELLFIVNSYNRDTDREHKSKRHRALYRAVAYIIETRKNIQKRTFVLSLTHDVGPDKDMDHGFSIPMFPIKEKTREVLEAKVEGKNPW
jgi:hypothetical protein